MPLNINEDLPKTFPSPSFLTLDTWKKGVITLIDKSKLPKDSLQEADNILLVEDGMPSVRPGVGWYGTEVPNGEAIQGFDYFDYNGAIHIVAVAAGVIYRSTDNAETWTICTGATLDTSADVKMNQHNAYLYITNGVDSIVRYDGTTTLVSYNSLVTPAAPSAAKTGLGATTYTYYYKISAVNDIGFSIASTAGSIQVSLTRENWDTSSNYVTLTLPALQANQERYDIYISDDNTNFYYLSSTNTTTYKDDGTAIIVPSTTAPTGNTTQGPKVEELVNVGSRMYGVRDTENRYRIWFTSGFAPLGAFSTAYGGGFLDWQPGGKFIPVQVEDYRDGKGEPYATVWCDSADGQGSILQMSLTEYTIQDITIIIPGAYQLPGSRGTPAPGSVVNVLNDYMYYNQQAFYNLGSRAQFLNLLSTDEASANIRPTVKQVNNAAENKICSVYYDAKVFFSVPYGSEENNAVVVYDTERKAWLPYAFKDIGFKQFLRYTEPTGAAKLLATRPGDAQLSEISESIQGDYGVPFATSLVTGLYPVSRNRFDFQWVEEGELEFSNPQGSINIELLGIERSRGFTATNTSTITVESSGLGWDIFDWDTMNWDDTSIVPDTFSSSTEKRYFNVNRELNAIQWRVTTNSLDAGYVLRTLQTWGTPTQGGKPRSWKL